MLTPPLSSSGPAPLPSQPDGGTCKVGKFVFAYSFEVPPPPPSRSASAPPPGGPLGAALKETIADRWSGMRSEKRNVSQARAGVRTLQAIAGEALAPEGVTKAHLREAVAQWRAAGTGAATIVARLNCLSAMGVNVQGCRPKVPRTLKWFLDDANEAKIVASLVSTGGAREQRLAILIKWTTRTGLRIEESLRLTWADIRKGVQPGTVMVTVPGMKTVAAQATLPLSAEAAALLHLARRGLGREPMPGDPVFGLAYWEAQRLWCRHRKVFERKNPGEATLKALRRSAARHLHGIKGMPLDMVRHVLRHENVQTTMSYLHLTGGYSEAEMAKWL